MDSEKWITGDGQRTIETGTIKSTQGRSRLDAPRSGTKLAKPSGVRLCQLSAGGCITPCLGLYSPCFYLGFWSMFVYMGLVDFLKYKERLFSLWTE